MARLGTVTAEGRPHVVPCCFALDGDVLYTVVDDIKAKTTSVWVPEMRPWSSEQAFRERA